MPFLHPAYLSLFDWVWKTSARVSVLIILLLLVKSALRNKIGARLHYLLWSVVIVSLLVPWAPQNPFSIYNFTNSEIIHTFSSLEGVKVSPVSESPVSGTLDNSIANPPEQVNVVQNTAWEFANANQSLNPDSGSYVPDSTSPLTKSILFLLWITGVTMLFASMVVVNIRFAQRIQGRPVADRKILSVFHAAKQNLGVSGEIPIIETQAVTTPSLFGVFHPKLLMPIDVLDEFTSAQLNHIFVHELLHLKRKDILVNWLTRVLLFVHWFNPIIWYAFFRLREDQELACDELAVLHLGASQSKEYAQTLVKLVESYSGTHRIASLACLSGSKSQIKRRITMLSVFKKASVKWAGLSLLVVILIAVVTLTSAKANTPKEENLTSSAAAIETNTTTETAKSSENKTTEASNSEVAMAPLFLDEALAEKYINISKDFDLRLPARVPEHIEAKAVMELPRVFKTPDGIELPPSPPTFQTDFWGNDKSFTLAQTKNTLNISNEEVVNNITNKFFRNDEFISFEIQGHPAFYRDREIGHDNLYIVTDTYGFTLITQTLSKEEVIAIANSIDLSNL